MCNEKAPAEIEARQDMWRIEAAAMEEMHLSADASVAEKQRRNREKQKRVAQERTKAHDAAADAQRFKRQAAERELQTKEDARREADARQQTQESARRRATADKKAAELKHKVAASKAEKAAAYGKATAADLKAKQDRLDTDMMAAAANKRLAQKEAKLARDQEETMRLRVLAQHNMIWQRQSAAQEGGGWDSYSAQESSMLAKQYFKLSRQAYKEQAGLRESVGMDLHPEPEPESDMRVLHVRGWVDLFEFVELKEEDETTILVDYAPSYGELVAVGRWGSVKQQWKYQSGWVSTDVLARRFPAGTPVAQVRWDDDRTESVVALPEPGALLSCPKRTEVRGRSPRARLTKCSPIRAHEYDEAKSQKLGRAKPPVQDAEREACTFGLANCTETALWNDGIYCRGSSPHFACHMCFGEYVCEKLERDDRRARFVNKHRCVMLCPICHPKPSSDEFYPENLDQYIEQDIMPHTEVYSAVAGKDLKTLYLKAMTEFDELTKQEEVEGWAEAEVNRVKADSKRIQKRAASTTAKAEAKATKEEAKRKEAEKKASKLAHLKGVGFPDYWGKKQPSKVCRTGFSD